MTNPTDPRVEAATLALLETDNYDLSLSDISLEAHLKEPHSGDCTRESHSCLRCICESAQREAILILKAADAAAWNTDIKEAPGQRSTIMVQLKSGRVTFANNEFPQGEDGWVDLLWPADGQDISETNIVAWRLIPRYQMPEAKP